MDIVKQDIDHYLVGCQWRFRRNYAAALRKHFFGLYRLEGTTLTKVYDLLFSETADTNCWGLSADGAGEIVATINVIADGPQTAICIADGKKTPSETVWKQSVPAEKKNHIPMGVFHHKHAIIAVYPNYIAYKLPLSKNILIEHRVDPFQGAHVFMYRGNVVAVNKNAMSMHDNEIVDEDEIIADLMRYTNIVSLSEAHDEPQRYLCEDNSGRVCICELNEQLRELLNGYV